MAVAILTLVTVLLARYSAPMSIYKMTWSPPKEWWASGYDFEHVNNLEPTESGKAIKLALFSVSVALIAWVARNAGLPTIVSFIIDVFAVSGAAAAVINAIEGWDRYIFGRVTLVLSGIALAHSTAPLIGDLNSASGEG